MPKRWIMGGIWAVWLLYGERVTAQEADPPGKLFVHEVRIVGNKRMSTEQIQALLHIKSGEEYTTELVEKDVRDLYKTNQFSNIQTWVKPNKTDSATIYFVVREMPISVQRISFLGAKHIKETELRNLVGISLNTPINPTLIRRGCEKIIARYEEMSRPFAQCVLVKGNDLSDTEVIYQITEGPKVTVRDIQFTGNTFVCSARLLTRLQSAKESASVDKTYNELQIKNHISELCNFYRRFGYRDVRISPEIKRCDENGSTVTLIFHIQEGKRYHSESENEPAVYFSGYDGPEFVFGTPEESATHNEEIVGEKSTRIGQIRVVGNKRISTESILAHIPLVPGQIVSDGQLRQVEKKLAALNLFVVDEAKGIYPTITVVDSENDGKQKALLINVKEKTISKTSSAKARR